MGNTKRTRTTTRNAAGKHHRTEAVSLVVEGFLVHWRTVRERLQAGEDVAQEREGELLAGSKSARATVARRFYSLEHAEHLASLIPHEVEELLSPWLDTAISFAVRTAKEWHEDLSGDKWTSFLRTLTDGEYVVAVSTPDLYGEDPPPLPHIVQPLPDTRVFYGDLYEICAGGASPGVTLKVYKSTGESFLPSERRSAEAGIRTEIISIAKDEAGDTEDWAVEFLRPDDREIVGHALDMTVW